MIFIRSYNPHDIVRQIKARRVSVLVSVPKILDVLREHIFRGAPERRRAAARTRALCPALVALSARASLSLD